MKYNPANAIKINMSKSQQMRAFRHADLDLKTAKVPDALAEAYKPLLNHIKENVKESWATLKPHLGLIPESLTKKHSDVMAQAMIYSELLGRAHTKKQNKLHLSNVLYQIEIDSMLAKKVMSMEEYKLLNEYEKLLAFSMAKVRDVKLLADINQTLADAMEKGQSFTEWKDGIDNVFDDVGITKLNGYYLQNVYRTNTFNAYMAGRWRAIYADIDSIAFITRMELPTCCEEYCMAVDGLCAPPYSDIWNEYGGLMHYQCRGDFEITYFDEIGGRKESARPSIKPMAGFGTRSLENVIPNEIMEQAKAMGITIDYRKLKKILEQLNSLGGF